jgi:hypothetical protein
MNSIIIVGAGQLGSRHLQALALLDKPFHIEVVDPSRDNLDTAISRFEEINGFEQHAVTYHTELKSLTTNKFDIAILATNANVRSKIIKELLRSNKVGYFILEKVLFQSIREYQEISELLKETDSRAFVNCTRRMFDFYQKLKVSVMNDGPVIMEVIGNNWGLGCNSIHFVDLFNFLTKDNITIWQNNLDENFIDSKRVGYKEFTGNLSGRTSSGNSLSLTCYNNGAPNASIRISNQNKRFIIEESLGKAWKSDSNNEWKAEEILFSMTYQSQLSHLVVNQLLETDDCMLTPYNISSSLHIPFIQTLLEHFNNYIENKTERCPIT